MTAIGTLDGIRAGFLSVPTCVAGSPRPIDNRPLTAGQSIARAPIANRRAGYQPAPLWLMPSRLTVVTRTAKPPSDRLATRDARADRPPAAPRPALPRQPTRS